MSRPTRAEMRALAESAERSAARSDAAAASGDATPTTIHGQQHGGGR